MSNSSHPQLKLAMVLKAHQLSKQSDSVITVKDVHACVLKKWKHESPRRFHQAIFDVFDCSLDDVIQAVIKDSIKTAIKAPLSDYEDVIGGSK
jgi:hypothetical protein